MSQADLHPSHRLHRRLAPALILLTLLAFSRSLWCGFINFDDDFYVYNNPQVLSGFTGSSLGWAWSTLATGNRHPLTWYSLMLDTELSRAWDSLLGRAPAGPNPFVYHLTNILIHAINAWLVLALLRRYFGRILGDRPLMLAGLAAIWALHPLRVESVTWISERKDVLSALFGLITLLCWRRYVICPGVFLRRFWFASVLLAYALSLLGKPMLVTLPALLILLEIWPLERPRDRWMILDKLPLAAMALIAGWFAMDTQFRMRASADWSLLPLVLRVNNAMIAYVRYLQKCFDFTSLALLYPHPERWPLALVYSATALLAILSLIFVFLHRRKPALLLGWLWFVGLLVPVIGILQVGSQSMADRYTYLPMIGLIVILGSLIPRCSMRLEAIGLSVIVVILGAASWNQQSYWQDGVTAFEHALSKTPPSELALNNLGSAYVAAGFYQKAIPALRQSIKLEPRGHEAYNNLGLCHSAIAARARNSGDPDLAALQFELGEAAFLEALRIKSDFGMALVNLALNYMERQRLTDAIQALRHSIQAQPDYAPAYFHLGDLYLRTNRMAEGIQLLQRALILDPANHQTRTLLIRALDIQRKLAN